MPKLKPTPEQELITEIKVALVRNGWTQKHLAKLCGMDPGNLSRAIKNPGRQKYETLCTIARKLGMNTLPII